MRILVVCGGVSDEREVSLCSGARVYKTLCEKGHEVDFAQIDAEMPDEHFLQRAREADAVFLCLHGGAGENGRWQEALERAGIFHYTGSGPTASALAMNKPEAKACVAKYKIPVADGYVWQKERGVPPLSYPFAVKPCDGGSSVGFHIVKNEQDWRKLAPSGDLLCENYLPGREYSVAVFKECALPPVEICPRGGVYDYAHKYEAGATKELCPAPLPATRLAQLQNMALICFKALGLRDFARVDFKEDAEGTPHFLEANTLPGMTQTSLFPLAACTAGISAQILCENIAQMAAGRKLKTDAQ